MKKIGLLSIVFALFIHSNSLVAQDSGSDRMFHFGLKVAPALSWFSPGDKKFTNNGVKFGFGYGLITEFGFSKNYAFSTGLEILNAGGKLTFPKSPDKALYTVLNTDVTPNRNDTFLLFKRDYKLRYINVPLLLKLKTNQLGAMTYFGQFGLDASFKWSAKANDDVSLNGTESTRNDVDIAKDINFIRLALNVGLGAEYNLSGSTSLVFSINYNNGFTNAMRKDSKMLLDKNLNALSQKAVFNYVALTVGVLF
jgi:hypothetical protein